MEALIDLLADYARELIIAVFVLITFWAAKRALAALKNWRVTVNRLAESKKAKSHEKLTNLLIQAASGSPIIVSYAIPVFAVGLTAILLLAVAAGITLDSYRSAADISHKHTLALGALEILEKAGDEGQELTENAKFAVQETTKSSEAKIRESLSAIRILSPVSKAAFGGSVLILTVSAVFAYVIIYRVMPNQLTSLPLCFWMEKYVSRLTAIATKDEARQLVGLEQNVVDEASLYEYVTCLRELANKYRCDVPNTLARWIEATDDRRARLAVATAP